MNLVLDHWTKQDILEYKNFSKTLLGAENEYIWEQKIVNTKLKCFGKTSAKAKILVKDIKKGNFFEFLDNLTIENHLDSLVCAFLISSIKDFEVFETYLNKFVLTIDNWASTDTLRFQKKDKEKLYNLSLKYIKSKLPFVRRTGLNIFFELIKDEHYLLRTFDVLNSLNAETEYYVNMCAAWLLAECFAKHHDATLNYFKNNSTNSFIINKAISKCRDSFRVTKQDKELLLQFKKVQN